MPGAVAVREHRPGDLAHVLAGRVGNLQLDALDLILEVPRDDRRLRRVLAEERLVAPELIVAVACRAPEHRGRRRREQLRARRRRQRRRVLLDRLEVVEDPDRAAVRGEEHRVVARVQRDLVDPHRRQVGLQPLPALAAIERHEEARLGSEIEHVGILQILGQRPRDLALEVRRHRSPRLAEVVAGVDVGLEVVLPVAVERGVHRAFVEPRRHDFRNVDALGHARDLLDHLRPRLAGVARHRQIAVVGAGVEHAGAFRRLREGDDRRPRRDAVVFRDG